MHHSSGGNGRSTVCEYFAPDLLYDFALHLCTSIILATKVEAIQILMVLAMTYTSPTVAGTCTCSVLLTFTESFSCLFSQ